MEAGEGSFRMYHVSVMPSMELSQTLLHPGLNRVPTYDNANMIRVLITRGSHGCAGG